MGRAGELEAAVGMDTGTGRDVAPGETLLAERTIAAGEPALVPEPGQPVRSDPPVPASGRPAPFDPPVPEPGPPAPSDPPVPAVSGASARGSGGIQSAVLARGTSRGGLRIKPPKGRTDVVVRTVTVAPGASTGWHHHTGPIVAVVQSGTLTRILHDCSVETISAGEAFVEPAGRRRRHIGHNFGTEPVVLFMTCLLPEGAPLSVDAEAPDCAGRGPA